MTDPVPVEGYAAPAEFVRTVYTWPAHRVRQLQEERFRDLMAWAWQIPFYRRRWEAVGLTTDDIASLDDLHRIPQFTVDDLRQSVEGFPPFGDYQFRSPSDLRETAFKLHTSGGTVGAPRPTLFSGRDWDLQGLIGARSLYLLGARRGDVFQVPLTCSLANAGWAFYEAAFRWIGCLTLTTGSGAVTPSQKQLEYAFTYMTNIWVSFPEYLLRLAEVAAEVGHDLAKLPTKFIVSFLGPDVDGSLRAELEGLWRTRVYDTYGTHEIGRGAFECTEQNGLHVSEDSVVLEVVDVQTGEPLPDGQPGNLVATVLWRRHPTFVRLNLLDVSRVVTRSKCRCGSYFLRIDHFLGRSDQMVKIRGTNVFPMACQRAVRSVAGTTGEWLCVVEPRVGAGGGDTMTVRVECDDANTSDATRDELERALHRDLSVRVTVELVAPGSLQSLTGSAGEGKAKRILDLRSSPSATRRMEARP